MKDEVRDERQILLHPSSFILHPFLVVAFLDEKLADNAAGKFYVDRNCIDCDVCRCDAPRFFARNDENGYSFVQRQPATPDEIALCEAAVKACPVDAIGDDG